MSTTAEKLTLDEALREAGLLACLFAGTYARWCVAGSARRRKPEVGDVEHVVIPEFLTPRDLIGDPMPRVNLMTERANVLLSAGALKLHDYGGGRTRNGTRYVGLDLNGRLHELFLCAPENWGCILTIRTGPAEFSRQFVMRLRERGYRQHEGYLEQLWSGRWNRIECPDEAAYFRAAGYDGVMEPEDRC